MLTADGCVKLIDFGLTKRYGTPERQHSINVTSRFYRAPEILFGGSHYGPAIDMWGLGCIFAELVLKEVLFPGSSEID
jgi:serine/threonine protein kinase